MSKAVGSWAASAVGSLVGVLVGGFITYQFNERAADNERVLSAQYEIYADYAKAQARYMSARTEEAVAAANPAILEARFRLALMGPTDVVRSVAAFTREVDARGPCPHPASDIAVYHAIRQSMLKERYERVSTADMAMTLFGCVPPPG